MLARKGLRIERKFTNITCDFCLAYFALFLLLLIGLSGAQVTNRASGSFYLETKLFLLGLGQKVQNKF